MDPVPIGEAARLLQFNTSALRVLDRRADGLSLEEIAEEHHP